MNTPFLGQIVYYKSRGSLDGIFPPTDRAAIITHVRTVAENPEAEKNQVRLCVLNPDGMFFTDYLYQGQDPGNWDFIPEGIIPEV
jgi:hypothetical protein